MGLGSLGSATPELSVIVCSTGTATPDETVASIAASAEAADARVEAIVIWQASSPPPAFEAGTRVLDVLPVGLSHARNCGLEAAQAELVAFVDDDELVDSGWVAATLRAFRREPEVAGVFGPVAPRDSRGLPYCHYEGSEPRSFSRGSPPWVVGTGGNMAFRRDAIRRVGGFDLRFGAGSSGHAAEESDLIFRLLRSGATLDWAPEMAVYHPTKNADEHFASRYPYAFGLGRVVRRHRAFLLGAKYLWTIAEALLASIRHGDRRRRRETLATLRGYLAGIVSRPTAISPLEALERAPEELRAALKPGRSKPLPLRAGDPIELRYRLGRGAVLHGLVDEGQASWSLRGRSAAILATPEPALDPAPELPPPADAAAATTGALVLTGSLWQTASTLLPQAYVLIQSVIAARFLGPSGMGVQSLIAFTTVSLTALLSQGLSVALMRFIGETRGRGRPDQLRDLVRWGWIVEGVAAVLGAGVLSIVALAGGTPRAAWFIVAFVCGIGVLHTIPTAVLIGAQRFRQASLVGLVTAPIATVGMAIALAAGGGITGMFAVEAVVSAANMAWTTVLARRTLAGLSAQATPSPELRRQVGRFALLMTYSSVLTFVVWRRSELFFLQRYSTHSAIALYSIAFSAMTALVAVPQAISTVISPAVATLFGANAWDRIRSGYSRGLRLLLLTTLPLTAGALAVGPALIRLVYGEAYRGTGPVLLILLAPLPLIPLINLARAFLAGLGRLHFQLAVGTVAVFVNLAFDYALIPRHGAQGAAVANAAAQLIGGLPLFFYACHIVGDVRWQAAAIVRTVVASAATWLAGWGAVTVLGGATGVIVGIAAGTAAFMLSATMLHVLPAEDAAWLDSVVGTRFGGRLGRAVRAWSMQPAPTRG